MIKLKRSLWYKRVRIVPAPSHAFILGDVLQAKLNSTADKWVERCCPARDDAEETHALNEFDAKTGMLFGRLLAFRRGIAQEVCRLDESAASIPVHILELSDPNEEFNLGHLFFGIDGNHIVLLQSQSLRFKQLEHWLNVWLEKELGGAKLVLDDIIPDNAKLKLKGVRSVSVEFGMSERTIASPRSTGGAGGEAARATSAFLHRTLGAGRIGQIIQRLGDRSITARIVFEAPSRKRRKSDDVARVRDDVLDDLAAFVSVQEDLDFVIRYNERDTLRSDELRISQDVTFETEAGQLSLEQVAKQLAKWLGDLQASKRVSSGRR